MGERVRWVGGEGEVGGGRKTVGHYTIMHTTGRKHLHCYYGDCWIGLY